VGQGEEATTTVTVVEDGVRVYRKKVKREARPREEWTAIPAPDSGIPPETLLRARESIEGNTLRPSQNSNRTWELSGGIGVCGHCGSRLKTHTTSNAAKTKYFYYICPKRTSNRDYGTCPNTKHYRAEELGEQVGEALADALEASSWQALINRTFDQKIKDLEDMG
jgi:hypothetical protein